MSNWKLVRPLRTTNLCENPRFDDQSTTGWATSGTNTFYFFAPNGTWGDWAVQIFQNNNATLASYSITLLTAGTYIVSGWIKVADDWDGGDIYFSRTTFAGSTETISRKWTAGTDPTGEWLWIYSTFTIDNSDKVGSFTLVCDSPGDTGKSLLFDGVQIENSDGPTTYCDGDQPGCRWMGEPGFSTSQRLPGHRGGGLIVDLKDDLGLNVELIQGGQMPNIRNTSLPRALTDGSEHQRSFADKTELLFRGVIIGDTLADYHAKRSQLVSDFGPDQLHDEPVRIEYWNGLRRRRIEAYYHSGLSGNKRHGFDEKITIKMEAPDPYWHSVHWSRSSLDSISAPLISYIAMRDEPNAYATNLWSGIDNQTGGTVSSVNAVLDDGQYVYIGGNFTNWDGDASADYAARWERKTDTWGAMSTGPGVTIKAMAFDTNGDVVVVTNSTVKRWNGTTWSDVGTYTGGSITTFSDIAVDRGGNIWVCGDFTNLGGVSTADYIAYFDGTNWNGAGTGANAWTTSLGIDVVNDLVYAGGTFTSMGGVGSTNKLAVWNWNLATPAWESVGGGITTGTNINAFLVNDDGTVYIAGPSTNWGGVACNYITLWNGNSFEPLGDGVDASANYLVKWRGHLVVGGIFSEAGGIDLAGRAALWNGSSWCHIDIEPPASGVVTAMQVGYNGELIICYDDSGTTYAGDTGLFTNNGNVRAYPIVTIQWHTSGTGIRFAFMSNELTKKMVWMDYDLKLGEVLTIDFRPGHRAMYSSVYGRLWSIFPNSDFVDFYIEPGEEQLIAAYAIRESTEQLRSYAIWQNRYFGID
jgi:hypothetical protein